MNMQQLHRPDYAQRRRAGGLTAGPYRTGAMPLGAAVSTLFLLLTMTAASYATVTPTPGMHITVNTTFTPGTYNFSSGQGIFIDASNITVDGNGAVLVGPGVSSNPNSYIGTGVTSTGVSGVTLKNLTVSGFLVGLTVTNGSNWNINNNNFSSNYTNPNDSNFGEEQLYGGMQLFSVSSSSITQNTADNNWVGLYLNGSNSNTISNNHCSPCSNRSLQLWASSNNTFTSNTMSYGFRNPLNNPNALDTASVLIETASNNNTFQSNDFTHGGDGVFIRSLNNIVSTGNQFTGNDGSYSYNNAWECWSPGNTFNNNKGNYSDYGFWLGGAQHTVLINNEAAFNGLPSPKNPQGFGIAGIAVVNGPSSHFICEHNNVHDNNGTGIAVGNPPVDGIAAFHWVLQQNTITNNASYPIYLFDADWLDIAGNTITGNGNSNTIYIDSTATNVFQRTATMTDAAPTAVATATATTVTVGSAVTFDASGSTDPNHLALSYRWSLGDGTIATTAAVTHTYAAPGFYRVGVTVNDSKLADLKWFDVYVLDSPVEIGTEGQASTWSWFDSAESPTVTFTNDTVNKLLGTESIQMNTTAAFPFNWYYPTAQNAAWNLSGDTNLEFWLKQYNANSPAWQDGTPDPLGAGMSFNVTNPMIVLYKDSSDYFVYTPTTDLLSSPSYPEALLGWQYVSMPLAGSASWTKSTVGSPSLSTINYAALADDTWNAGFTIWIDGLAFTFLAPTNLTATAGTGQVKLAWTASSGATSYNVYRGTVAGGEGTTAIATGVTGTSYTNTGLTAGTTYYFKVAGVNRNAISPQSNEASGTPTSGGGAISINCGGSAASPFVADTDFSGGTTSSTTHAIDTSLLTAPIPPQAVLQTNRHGAMTYTVGGFTGGSGHTITLYFEENYWTASGKRKFNVTINGTPELTNFDIFATAGAQYKGVQRSFTVNANGNGQEVIVFTNVTDNALCNGITVN